MEDPELLKLMAMVAYGLAVSTIPVIMLASRKLAG